MNGPQDNDRDEAPTPETIGESPGTTPPPRPVPADPSAPLLSELGYFSRVMQDRALEDTEQRLDAQLSVGQKVRKIIESSFFSVQPSRTEKTKEPLRERAMAPLKHGAFRQAVDGTLRTLTGYGLDEIKRAIDTGTLPSLVSLRLIDPVSSAIETVAREEGRKADLDPNLIGRVAGTAGFFASMMMPPGGKVPLRLARGAGELRLNLRRVGATDRVKALMEAINRSNAERLAEHRQVRTLSAVEEEARTAFASLEDALRATVDELLLSDAKATAFRNYYNLVGRRVDDLAERVERGIVDALDEWYDAMTLLIQMSARDEVAGARLARGLGARRIISQAEAAAIPGALEKAESRARAQLMEAHLSEARLRGELTKGKQQAGVQRLEQQLERAEARVTDLEGQVAGQRDTERHVASITEALADARARANTLQEEIAAQPTVTRERQRQLEAAQARVDVQEARLREAQEEGKAAAQLTQHLADERARAQALRGEIAAVTKQTPNLTVLEQRVTKAQETIARFSEELEEARLRGDLARGIARAPLSPQEVGQLADLFKGAVEADPMAMLRRWRAMTKHQQQVFAHQARRGLKEGQTGWIYFAWINSLLSGPQTHAANAASNTLTAAWAIPERALAATAAAGEWAVTLGRHPREVFFGEVPALVYGMLHGFKDGLHLAKRGLLTGETGFGGEKVEGATRLRQALTADPTNTAAHAAAGLSALLPTRWLTASDGFFKGINYRGELHALAYRDTMLAGLGKLQETNPARFREYVQRAIAEPNNRAIEQAMQAALTRTFNRELADLGAVGQMGQGVAMALHAWPIGRLILPFVRTPTNILHYTLERTPVLNLIATDLGRQILHGTGAERAEALAKLGVSAMAAAVVSHYAAAGLITGPGPLDPVLREQLRRTGWLPWAFKVGGTHYQINRLDPFGSVIGAIAATTEILGQLPEYHARELTTALVLALSRSMISKTYLEGLSNLVEALEHPERANLIGSYARTLVPTALRSLERAMDPALRETRMPSDEPFAEFWELLREIQAVTPGWSASLPPRRNRFGEIVYLPPGWGPDMLSPIYHSPEQPEDEVTETLNRLKVGLTKPDATVYGRRVKRLRLDDKLDPREGLELNAQDHDQLIRLTGEGFKDHLRTLIKMSEFQQQSEAMQRLKILEADENWKEQGELKLFDQRPDLLQRALDKRQRLLQLLLPPGTSAGSSDQPSPTLPRSLGR